MHLESSKQNYYIISFWAIIKAIFTSRLNVPSVRACARRNWHKKDTNQILKKCWQTFETDQFLSFPKKSIMIAFDVTASYCRGANAVLQHLVPGESIMAPDSPSLAFSNQTAIDSQKYTVPYFFISANLEISRSSLKLWSVLSRYKILSLTTGTDGSPTFFQQLFGEKKQTLKIRNGLW